MSPDLSRLFRHLFDNTLGVCVCVCFLMCVCVCVCVCERHTCARAPYTWQSLPRTSSDSGSLDMREMTTYNLINLERSQQAEHEEAAGEEEEQEQ